MYRCGCFVFQMYRYGFLVFQMCRCFFWPNSNVPMWVCWSTLLIQQSRLGDHFLSLRPSAVFQSGETSCETWRLFRLLLRLNKWQIIIISPLQTIFSSTNFPDKYCSLSTISGKPTISVVTGYVSLNTCLLTQRLRLLLRLNKQQIIIFQSVNSVWD